MTNKGIIAVGRVQMKNVPEGFKCRSVKSSNFNFFQSKKSVQRQKIFDKNSTALK